jgi:hypothetical protein
MIIQMQGGSINNSNTAFYGSGTSSGNGYTSLGSAGLYEFATVISSGPVVTLKNVLSNNYSSVGNNRFQAIRVPLCTLVTVHDPVIPPWDGSVGGVFAVLGESVILGNVSLQGKGYRGAPDIPDTSGLILNWFPRQANYRDNSGVTRGPNGVFNGAKGEGFIGYSSYNFSTPNTTYPGGFDCGMGAPGNAGGGGIFTDAGGGGGANAGQGGDGRRPNHTYVAFDSEGGLGGAPVPLQPTQRLFPGQFLLYHNSFSDS